MHLPNIRSLKVKMKKSQTIVPSILILLISLPGIASVTSDAPTDVSQLATYSVKDHNTAVSTRRDQSRLQPRDRAIEKYGNPKDGSLYHEVLPEKFIHYREHGKYKPTLPTYVLIPGTTDTLHNWQTLADLLATDSHVIRIDTPGFGLSSGINAEDFQRLPKYFPGSQKDFPLPQAEVIKMFIEQIGLKNVVLVGSSLGGMYAWIIASQKTSFTISQLILLAPVAFPGSIPRALGWVDEVLGFIILKRPDLARKVATNNLSRIINHQIFAKPERVKNISEIRERAIDLFFTEVNVDTYIDILQSEGDYRFQHTGLIPNIKTPTLVVYGMQDKIVPPKQYKLWQKNLSGVRTSLLPDVGHLPHIEVPALTAKMIQKFVAAK